MIKAWIAAGCLSLFTSILRGVAGHRTPLADARASSMELESVVILHSAWYVVTGLCFTSAVVYIYLGCYPKRLASSQIAGLLSAIFLLSAVIVVVVNSVYGWSVMLTLPVLLLSVIGILGLAGIRNERGSHAA
jgi:hypothetical protein